MKKPILCVRGRLSKSRRRGGAFAAAIIAVSWALATLASQALAFTPTECSLQGGFCDASNTCRRQDFVPERGFVETVLGRCGEGGDFGGPVDGGSGGFEPVAQVPTSLQVLAGGVAEEYGKYDIRIPGDVGSNGCPMTSGAFPTGEQYGPFGAAARVRYQVLDQFGQAIRRPVQIFEDIGPTTVTIIDGNGREQTQSVAGVTGVTPLSGEGFTNSDGTFVDEPIGICFRRPVKSGIFTQQLYVPLLDGGRFVVRSNTISVQGAEDRSAGCGTVKVINQTLGDEVTARSPRRACPGL